MMAEGVVTLTFDDGFLKTTNFARDILNNYEIKGCFFIPVGFIGKKFMRIAQQAICSTKITWRQIKVTAMQNTSPESSLCLSG